MSKLTHFALLSAVGFTALQAAEAPAKPWMVIADWQTRSAETVNHANPVSGTFGRSRSGTEVIWATPTAAVDFEYYRYKNDFTGTIQGSDQAYGHTTDLMLT